MTLEELSEIAGAGDREKDSALFLEIAMALYAERCRQPLFAEGPYHALGKIGESWRLFESGIENGGNCPRAAALALIARLCRYLNGEHEAKSCCPLDNCPL